MHAYLLGQQKRFVASVGGAHFVRLELTDALVLGWAWCNLLEA
jgi:hypothetical protein